MHIISEERALAHWRTLCCIPPATAESLADRFVREQPALVAVMLAGGLVSAQRRVVDQLRLSAPKTKHRAFQFLQRRQIFVLPFHGYGGVS